MEKIRFIASFACVCSLVAVFLVSVKVGTETTGQVLKKQKESINSKKEYSSSLKAKLKIDSKKFIVAEELEKYLAKSKKVWSKEEKEDVVDALLYIESKYGYRPLLFLKLMKVESNFEIDAVSPDGAVGLCQIQPNTAKAISLKMGSPSLPREMLFDPVINLKLSAYYLNYLESKYKALPKALTAYNMGPQKYFEIYGEGGIPQSAYHKKISD
ncbi:MAG: transglycosylase SLT domain-containing protein [Acidobacteria bacterium]|nr:transglycosylase SLT domain-containing protein [Acidobacteriota bacterium]